MRRWFVMVLIVTFIATLAVAQEDFPTKVKLRMMVAGDQNMVDFFQYEIAPEFEKVYPNVKVEVVGTGPGPAGSRQIIQQLEIERDSGKENGILILP